MSALAFYGASDDLVVVEVDGKPVDWMRAEHEEKANG